MQHQQLLFSYTLHGSVVGMLRFFMVRKASAAANSASAAADSVEAMEAALIQHVPSDPVLKKPAASSGSKPAAPKAAAGTVKVPMPKYKIGDEKVPGPTTYKGGTIYFAVTNKAFRVKPKKSDKKKKAVGWGKGSQSDLEAAWARALSLIDDAG